jgi:ABC-type transporter Mla MlaB component
MSYLTYSDRTFFFKDKISIYKVSEIKKLLLQFYNAESNKEGKFYLDLSQTESIDSAALQILISLKRTIENGKGKLEIKKGCQTFDSLIDLLGMPADEFTKSA